MDDSTASSKMDISRGPLHQFITRLNQAIRIDNCQKVVRSSRHTINQMLDRSLLTNLLEDIRTRYNAKKDSLEFTLVDLQQVIKNYPSSVIEYLCKVDIVSMYGNQIRPLESYDEGLQNTTARELLMFQSSMAAKRAVTQNDRRIDFIEQLPMEIASKIIMRLPLPEAVTCLTVSRLWRERVIYCTALWANISIGNDLNGIRVLSALPIIVHYVRHVTVTSGLSFRYYYIAQTDGMQHY
ncbi:hypothetical protein BJV82DRAFT_581472 [Fennellomyces sp. T-0311]|nr:hypothetical protein BJV82DRAFT_581472 [Fennellomyces sp. T-0311]